MVIAPYSLAVDRVMCSEVCPCDPGTSNKNKLIWQSLDAQMLKSKYKRVLHKNDLSPTEAFDYAINGYNAEVVPFIWIPFGYSKYQDCYKVEL